MDVLVPCGKCQKCTARRISGWSVRLMEQEKNCTSAAFITLTYSTQHVPISSHGFMTLTKGKQSCLTLFFKKLRKAHGKISNIKYYASGEYGGRTNRPHYHIILFNARSELLQPAWAKGEIHYGTVSDASVGYTLKYISKPKNYAKHSNNDRIPEFSVMSKGLGLTYLSPEMVEWHMNDMENRMYCNVRGTQKKVAMPRYYKDKLYSQLQRQTIAASYMEKIAKQTIEEFHSPDYEQKKHNKKQAILFAYEQQQLLLHNKKDKL